MDYKQARKLRNGSPHRFVAAVCATKPVKVVVHRLISGWR